MNRQLSLTDVQNGMFRLSIHVILTPPCFQFFWGLIMTANGLQPRFRNPFDLTVSQAIGVGGGNSRQAVWIKQQRLKEVKVDGQWLIKIRNGNRQKNVPAKYEINYDLLVPQSLVVPEFKPHQSKIHDRSIDGSVDASATDPLTILRSEERREDQIPPTPQNDVTTGNGSDVKLTEVDGLIKLLSEKFKLPNPPPYGLVNKLYHDYGLSPVADAIMSSEPSAKAWSGILGYIGKVARGISAQSRGVTGAKLDQWEAELRMLRDEYAAIEDAGLLEDPRNGPWMEENVPKIKRLEDLIMQNGGGVRR